MHFETLEQELTPTCLSTKSLLKFLRKIELSSCAQQLVELMRAKTNLLFELLTSFFETLEQKLTYFLSFSNAC
jgi:hypothetical protein